VFLMPWKNHMLVGTTETPYRGDPACVAPLQGEIDYLLATLARYMPARRCELLASSAGLRVLPKTSTSAFSRPRDVTLTVDDERAPHLVAIWGGKLTGYRATADKVLGLLRATLPARERVADTTTLTLP
jgi:glycerol-3-phosphate dehydrogenase